MSNKSIQETHTKALISELNGLRVLVNSYERNGPIEPSSESFDETMVHNKARMKLIKAELATRPHIPNKQEAKIIRQQKAQGKKS